MKINLISDTVTKPSPEMLDYMREAIVGDDVFRQDPTVIQLEEIVAGLFGMEAALFFPSGTMSNQVAINVQTTPGDSLLCDHYSHIQISEVGGIALNSGVNTQTIVGKLGKITAAQLMPYITPKQTLVAPRTSLVSLENTTNRGGGSCYELADLHDISQLCKKNEIRLHLDGARLWNALIAKKQQPQDYKGLFDTISLCFSKGLGAPVGSILLGDAKTIEKAIRVRKRLGGGMRQIGYLASACLFALQNNVKRLGEDHKRAAELATLLTNLTWVEKVEQPETNIVLFTPKATYTDAIVIEALEAENIQISALAPTVLRMVTHLDYTEEMHQYTMHKLTQLTLNY